MGNIGLIIEREYLSRVKKKSFIIMTIIGPLLFGAIVIVPTWLATRASTDQKTIWVLDESGYVGGELKDDKAHRFITVNKGLEEAKSDLNNNRSAALVYIPALDLSSRARVSFFAYRSPSFELRNSLRNKIKKRIEKIKLDNSGLKKAQLDALKAHVDLDTYNLNQVKAGGVAKKSSSEAASGAGYIGAFLIYIFIFLYGAQIMRGVIEEKTTKVVEVIISSVKPFQLMMGKILGIGAVGLTQFLLWVLLSAAIAGAVLIDAEEALAQQQTANIPVDIGTDNEVLDAIFSVNIPMVIACFIFYFLAGYLLYGALFAAVGSAVDSDADSQQFMLPITMPLIFSIVLIAVVLKEPHGSLAVWTSIIPFTAPVVMMMRIPFEVPFWQLALSMLSTVGGFLFTTWLAGRIYRIGIFMHGTKVNYRVLAKWFAMKI